MHFLIYFLPRFMPTSRKITNPSKKWVTPPKKRYLKYIGPWVYFWGFMVCVDGWMDGWMDRWMDDFLFSTILFWRFFWKLAWWIGTPNTENGRYEFSPKISIWVKEVIFTPIWSQNSIPLYFEMGSRDLFKTRSDNETPGIKKYEMFQKTLRSNGPFLHPKLGSNHQILDS